jgi:hypothetical protein
LHEEEFWAFEHAEVEADLFGADGFVAIAQEG